MKHNSLRSLAALWFLFSMLSSAKSDDFAAPLPDGVQAVWDIDKAFRTTTTTRERICINGLWRWQGASAEMKPEEDATPAGDWGYFKVPGCWPGITDYMQKDCQVGHCASPLEGSAALRPLRGLVRTRDCDS